jgi:hypothetical protein
VQNIPASNLNEDPEQPHLDLNVVPDMQEMIIDLVQVNHQQVMFLELNNLLNQVNEEEEHEVEIQEIQEEQNVEVNQIQVNPVPEVNRPALNHPAENFMHLEIHEEDLMVEDEIQEELNVLGNQAAPPEPENIQMGFVRTFFNNADPVMNLRKEKVAGSIEVPTGGWTNYFTPKLGTTP